MEVMFAGLLADRTRVVRVLKYASVSVIATATSLAVLGVLVGLERFPSVWANVIATALGTIPSFELNRRWVWSDTRGQRRVAQVVPFALLSLVGLAVSCLAVRVASDATAQSGRWVHTLSVEGANVCAYGVLWLVQFVLCDRVLFGARSSSGHPRRRFDATSGSAEEGPEVDPPRRVALSYEEISAR
jgi:putative flippase GtrA